MLKTYPTIKEARDQINALATTHVKVAALGGDGQDMSFEQAFSNLAHAYLSDKAPTLLDHELGFQLLERNDENTKAVGVFGFKVGNQLLFAPVFFLNGDLKGHELLYIKDQDMFVPMKENWLNYILNRKPNILGKSVERNTAQLGVTQPDLNRLSKSPWKYASADMPGWVNDILPKFAHTALTNVGNEFAAMESELNLVDFCKQANLAQLDMLVKTCQLYPVVGQAILEHHGSLDFIHEGIRNAKSCKTASVLDGPPRKKQATTYGSILDKQAKVDPNAHGKLEIIHIEHTEQLEQPEGVTEEEGEKLLQDGMLIKDRRTGEEVSVAYNTAVEQKLFNPTETGCFYILTKPNEFRKCFIAHGPHGPDGRKTFAVMVDLEDSGKRRWINTHPTRMWAGDYVDSGLEPETFKAFWDSLPDATAENVGSGSGRKLLIGQRGNATLPFRVEKNLGEERGGTVFDVDFSTYAQNDLSENVMFPTDRDQWEDEDARSYSKYRDGQRLHLDTKQGTQLRSTHGDLYVPTGYKLLTLDLEEDEDEDSIGSSGQSSTPPLRPGSLIDAELALWIKTSAEVVVRRNGGDTYIDDVLHTAKEALCQLVAGHGLREKAAAAILGEAELRGRKTFHIKYAQGFQGDPYLTNAGPSAPGFPGPEMSSDNVMGFPGPTIGMSEYALAVPGMIPANNRSAYDVRPDATGEPMDFDTIQKATQSGQKEVFDTAMIGSMLKAVRDDTMIDRYIPDLIKGLDRLGRILFMFYWHGDKFADRYGKMDMPELEDTLRNSFEMIGDTVLFLKQKTIEAYPDEGAADLDLSDTASV